MKKKNYPKRRRRYDANFKKNAPRMIDSNKYLYLANKRLTKF